MKHLLLTALIPFLAMSVHATEWTVDMPASELGFSSAFDGQGFDGVFKDFKADIRFDPQDLANASFDVTVNLASVDTGSDERDETLHGPDFFKVDDFPQARFTTTGFTQSADGSVTAAGTLTIRDHAQPINLAVTFTPGGDQATLKVRTTLERIEFGLGTGKDWAAIDSDVAVHGRLHLTRP